MSSQAFDIVIVGAGLVGCSLALALQQQGLKIAVLEKHLPDFSVCDDQEVFRPISLAYSSVKIFQTLGIWPLLSELAAPINTVKVSQLGALGHLSFIAGDYGLDALGQVVPFHALHRCLYQAMSQQTGVKLLPITALQSIDGNIKVQTCQGVQCIEATLLVGADGSQSRVRQLLNIPVTQRNQNELALIAKLNLSDDYSATALERLTRDGICAILPLKETRQCGFVWTMPDSRADTVKQWDDAQLQQFISQQFSRQLPTIDSLRRGVLWPLQTAIATRQVMNSVVLLGNAAHTIYPLAAQGFNLGLRAAAALAQVLVEALASQQSLDDPAMLQRYGDWQFREQKKITRLTGSISGIAGTQLPLAAGIRGLGLLATDLFPPMKHRIARLALGLSGKLPKLARGLPLW